MNRVVCLVIVVFGGCITPDKPCVESESGIADVLYRNPATGQCQSFGQPCNTSCGRACPGLAIPPPDWALCDGACDNLSETQCLAATTCHAAYQDNSAAKPTYWGCWGMPQSGPLHGSCASLDAQTCSAHDDCFSLYTGPVNQPPNFVPSFESCQPETAQATCASLATESDCLARADCDPIYNGSMCTCDPHGCTCQTEVYDHCK